MKYYWLLTLALNIIAQCTHDILVIATLRWIVIMYSITVDITALKLSCLYASDRISLNVFLLLIWFIAGQIAIWCFLLIDCNLCFYYMHVCLRKYFASYKQCLVCNSIINVDAFFDWISLLLCIWEIFCTLHMIMFILFAHDNVYSPWIYKSLLCVDNYDVRWYLFKMNILV